MTRLLVVDDHPIIVAGIEAMLRGTQFEIVRHVLRGDEAVAAIEAENPDIVILDERLPGKTGLDIFRELRANGHDRRVVMLTGTMPDRRAIEAVEAGVDGFVLKHAAADHLLACLEEVSRGGRWIEQSILQRALNRATGKDLAQGPFSRLTKREQAVVRLVAENVRNQQIAAQLGISEGTVKVHLHNIYEKLGLSSRVDLLMLIKSGG
jgi:two-component system, NarL family, nitrate/nitrite response regulator NarL